MNLKDSGQFPIPVLPGGVLALQQMFSRLSSSLLCMESGSRRNGLC